MFQPIMVKTSLLIAISCLLFVACQKTPSRDVVNPPKLRYFLVAHAAAGDPFWNIVFKGAKLAEKNLGVSLQIVAPEIPNDIARQVELLNAAIATKPAGIAVSIPDDRAFSASLKEAKRQKIAVVAFNTKPNDHAVPNNPYQAFIGMDDRAAASLLAKKALATNRLKDHVVVAIHQAGHIGLERRYLGIHDELVKSGIKVDKLDISSDASQAQQILKGFLTKNPLVSGIFFVGPFGVHAAARTLKLAHPQLLLASFDLTLLTVEMLQEQHLAFTVDQQPFMQGYLAITELGLNGNFALHPTDINTGVAIIGSDEAHSLAALVKNGVR